MLELLRRLLELLLELLRWLLGSTHVRLLLHLRGLLLWVLLLWVLLLWVLLLRVHRLVVLRLGHGTCGILRLLLSHEVLLLGCPALINRFANGKVSVVLVAPLLGHHGFRSSLGSRLGDGLLVHLPLVLLGYHHRLLVLVRRCLRAHGLSKVHRLRNRWCPVGWGLHLLGGYDGHRGLQNFDRERDYLSLTELVPRVVLDKDLDHVADIDDTTVHRHRERLQHRNQIWVHLGCVVLVVSVSSRDWQFKSALDFFALRNALFFLGKEVAGVDSLEAARVFLPLVNPHQLDLEGRDVLAALRVVADYSNASFLSQVVLILIKDDLSLGLGGVNADEATDLGFQVEFKLLGRVLDTRAVDIDHSGTLEA